MYQLGFMVAKDRKFSLSKKEFYVSENPSVEVALVGREGRIRESHMWGSNGILRL